MQGGFCGIAASASLALSSVVPAANVPTVHAPARNGGRRLMFLWKGLSRQLHGVMRPGTGPRLNESKTFSTSLFVSMITMTAMGCGVDEPETLGASESALSDSTSTPIQGECTTTKSLDRITIAPGNDVIRAGCTITCKKQAFEMGVWNVGLVKPTGPSRWPATSALDPRGPSTSMCRMHPASIRRCASAYGRTSRTAHTSSARAARSSAIPSSSQLRPSG